jgi:hypothetical protein
MGDLVGKIVRWEWGGQWFTAKVHSTGVMRGSWAGEVVDPGNFTGMGGSHPYFEEERLTAGQWLPNLVGEFLVEVESAIGIQEGGES